MGTPLPQGGIMDIAHKPRDIRRDALREVECWLTGEFRRSPLLPNIPLSPDNTPIHPMSGAYRAMVEYLFHWALETQRYHLHRPEIIAAIVKVAARYKKVTIATSAHAPE